MHLLSLKNAFRARLPSKLHRQLIHQHHLQSHLHCGNDPTVANHNEILSTAHGRNTVETPFTMRNRSETDPVHDPRMIRPHTRPSRNRRTADFVRDFLQNSIGNSSTSTTCNPIYIAGTILQLQITMRHGRSTVETPFTMRNRSETDPTMIRE